MGTKIEAKLDTCGRVSIPKVVRKAMNIEGDKRVLLFHDGNYIVLKKYEFESSLENKLADIIRAAKGMIDTLPDEKFPLRVSLYRMLQDLEMFTDEMHRIEDYYRENLAAENTATEI